LITLSGRKDRPIARRYGGWSPLSRDIRRSGADPSSPGFDGWRHADQGDPDANSTVGGANGHLLVPMSGHFVLPVHRENPLRVAGIGCLIDRPSITGGNMTIMALPTPTLHTARLRLRPFDDADANNLFALHSNARVLRYWDAPPWSERVRAERFITACRQMAQEGTGARLAVDRVCDGAFIGWCGLNRWNPDYRSARLGYCFDDAAWGRGYATEAARVLLRWAFGTLDLNRVQAETDTRNVASARVLEKLGFVREGTLREDCVVNGEVSDSWVYGLISREWRPSSEPVPAR
jgi:[ribosomal protein S5]-alanine N-acetyltransferase